MLDAIAARITRKARRARHGSVLFAVMDDRRRTRPGATRRFKALHARQNVFSYGISDNPGGIALYKPGQQDRRARDRQADQDQAAAAVQPGARRRPRPPGPPQVRRLRVQRPTPVVYCGSSNLALGGEEANGDNLLAIHDEDVATAFAIEALALVDHFDFLDSVQAGPTAKKTKNSQPDPSKPQAAIDAGWFLSTRIGGRRSITTPTTSRTLTASCSPDRRP